MDRRAFLRSMLSGTVGMTLDVDKLLWVPGEKTIFIPPRVPTYAEILDMWFACERMRQQMFYDFYLNGQSGRFDGGIKLTIPFNYSGGL